MHTIFAIIGLNNLLKAYEDKSAYAMCIFSLALGPEEVPITFGGKTPVRRIFEFTSQVLHCSMNTSTAIDREFYHCIDNERIS